MGGGDIRTTRDRIERAARNISGELVKSLACTLSGGLVKPHTQTGNAILYALTGRPKSFKILGGWGAIYPHRTEEREALPPFTLQAREMARDFQGRTRTKNNPTHHGRGPHRRARFDRTPRTIRPAPNRRARFNPARTHRSGRHDFERELYVNARASAGQGLATIQDKRGRGHPPNWKRGGIAGKGR